MLQYQKKYIIQGQNILLNKDENNNSSKQKKTLKKQCKIEKIIVCKMLKFQNQRKKYDLLCICLQKNLENKI